MAPPCDIHSRSWRQGCTLRHTCLRPFPWLVRLGRGVGGRTVLDLLYVSVCYLSSTADSARTCICPVSLRVNLQTPHKHLFANILWYARSRFDPALDAVIRRLWLGFSKEHNPPPAHRNIPLVWSASYCTSNDAKDGDSTAALHLLLICFFLLFFFFYVACGSRIGGKLPGDGEVVHLLVSASAYVYGLRRTLGGNLCHFDAKNNQLVRIFVLSFDGVPIILVWQNVAVNLACVSLHLFTDGCGPSTMYICISLWTQSCQYTVFPGIRSFRIML